MDRIEEIYEKCPLVSIIIPNYNGETFIERCLKSVLNTDYPNFEVIVIDDGSTDNSLKIVKELFGHEPRLRILKNDKNLGPATSCNIASKAARGRFIAFLGNDDEAAPNWIKESIKVFHTYEADAVFSKLIEFYDRQKIHMVGIYLIPYNACGFPVGLGEVDMGQHDRVRAACAVSTGLVVRREIIDRVGGFDEKLRCYTEDIDFSWRIWLAGYKMFLSPKSIVYYLTKSSEERRRFHGDTAVSQSFHLTKNSIRMMIKNYERKNLIKYSIWFLLILILKTFTSLKQHNLDAIKGVFKAILWNINNLSDTLYHRRIIQNRIQKVSDDFLFKKIFVNMSPLHIYRVFKRK